MRTDTILSSFIANNNFTVSILYFFLPWGFYSCSLLCILFSGYIHYNYFIGRLLSPAWIRLRSFLYAHNVPSILISYYRCEHSFLHHNSCLIGIRCDIIILKTEIFSISFKNGIRVLVSGGRRFMVSLGSLHNLNGIIFTNCKSIIIR